MRATCISGASSVGWATATTRSPSRSAPCCRARCRNRSGSRSRPPMRSDSSSPRTRLSASASLRPKSRTNAVTRAPRSSVRRSGRSIGSVVRSTSVPRCSSPAAATATHAPSSVCTLRPEVFARSTASATVVDLRGVIAREQAPLVVVHRELAAEHLGQHVTDLDDPTAVQQHVGEQVVRLRGALGRLRARPELGVGLVRRGNGSACLLEEASVLQGDRSVRGEGGQQRHLARGEGPNRAVHREQRTDDLALDGERHPEDGADLLALHGGVDVVAVHEPLVGLVVLREVRRSRLRHQPEQPGAEWQPQLAELGGERTVGHLHVRRPLQLVVEREVGHVGVQQLPRPPDDGGQDRVEVPDRREVTSGLEQRGQLGLPAALALRLLMDPQGECMLLAQRSQLLGSAPRDLRLGDHQVEVLPRRPSKQHLEKLRGDLHAPILPAARPVVEERAHASRSDRWSSERVVQTERG